MKSSKVIARLCLAALTLSSFALGAAPEGRALRWTDETPDAMIEAAAARANGAKGVDADAATLASIAVIATLADRATYGDPAKGLGAIDSSALAADLRDELALAKRAVATDEGDASGLEADRKLGVVTELMVLGPFRDTGGGLAKREGPEARGASFGARDAHYAWGTFDVAWRAVPREFAGAKGIPLDLFVHPRSESCSIVASEIALDRATPIVVRLASSGQARLMFDGVEVGKSEDVNASAMFDRLAAKIDARAGDHLIAAKVCTGALDDDGRVRLRLTDANGAPLAFTARTDLRDAPSTPKKGEAPQKITKLTTPLERALTAGPSVDAQIATAVLRTLGGADDTRSPRAPGLLDAITRRTDIDADRLAMAGWIAPSGANRSGWLRLAETRGEHENDAKARAFAERRLVAEHVNSGMGDWAMASLRGAKIDTKEDAEARLLLAATNVALGTTTLRARAVDALANELRAHTKSTPTALLHELTELATGSNPAIVLEADAELVRRGHRGEGHVTANAIRGARATAEAANVAFQSGAIDDAGEGIAIARAAANAGVHDVARALYAKLVEWAPNRADVWAGLADEIAQTRDPKAEDATLAALRRARALDPSDARARDEISLRTSARGQAEAHDDEHYLVPSQTILARRTPVPAVTGGEPHVPDVADRQLYWLRAVVMHPDNRVSQLIQYAREIVIPPRTVGELFEDLPAEGDLTEILRARVHRKDGGEAFPTEEHGDPSRPRVRWPDLAPGDVVEVAIRTWTSNPVGGRGESPFYFLDYGGGTSTHPVLYNEVVVESSPAHPIYVDVLHGGAFKRTESDENGHHTTRLVWDAPPTVPDEPLAPQLSETLPLTVGSTFRSWVDFRAWYTEAIRGFTQPDEEVRRLAAELTKGKTTRESKLSAIFNFVADDIRYVNYVSGESWLPNRPQQLLARREGDCDDKALLLITLLRAVGIEAQEVMVQTRQTNQPSILLAQNAAVPLFDHGIAFLPGPNGGTYLDATSPEARLGPLPSMDARALALRLDGPPEIVHLPAGSPESHGSDVTWTIAIAPDGSGELTGEEKHSGDNAFWLRTSLTQADARRQWVEDNLVSGWFPTVDVDKKIEFKGDLPNGQAWVKYRAHSDGLARLESNELVIPLAPSQTLASQLAPLVKRTLPVVLPPGYAPKHEDRTIRITAPAGFTWAALPPGGDENGGTFGRAHLEIAKDAHDPRVVVVKRSLVFDDSTIAVDKYAAWRAWLLRVDALMHKSVRMTEGKK